MKRAWLIALLLQPSAALTNVLSQKNPLNCIIDYSAANEFVKAHHGIATYFPSNCQMVAVLDARNGILEAHDSVFGSSIHRNGFQLVHVRPTVVNWRDLDQVSSVYLPELKRIVSELNPTEKIAAVVFWHPMLRGEDFQVVDATPDDGIASSAKRLQTAPVASLVHIDTDIQAYTVDDLVQLIFKNRVFQKEERSNTDAAAAIFRSALMNRQRFAVWNFWRNIGTEPVRRSPLGIYLPRYSDSQQPKAFPAARPDPNQSRWYYYSNMTPNECLVFKQYDRRLDCVSDLWHCALPLEATAGADEKRRSFDLRALIVYDEQLPTALDRYKSKQSLLTLEQSECFCRAQGEQRRQQQ